MIAILLGLAMVVMVALGGAIGAVGRWAIAEYGPPLLQRRWPAVTPDRSGPWMTFVANVLACFLLGIVVTLLGSAAGVPELFSMLLAVGLCGGLSTLSTAALDVVALVRRGTPAISLGYLCLTIGIGMSALWLGVVIAR
ncbi:fluoride efflux transporter FluC [Brachybacterium squillarum]|uniref:fluoride efflux transporter FluC n=1 Tax=Brachybacterium squillarum TaxID=661979 RepID=UPI00026293BB|nr:CrcB family protein [Brachybacterium squillarum]